MPLLQVHVPPGNRRFERGFERIRRELETPQAFDDAVLRCAEAAVRNGPRTQDVEPAGGRRDARDLPLLTIDPPGSRDLDQAFGAERRGDGFRVYYAIADVAAFVEAGDPVDQETRERGVTLYAPDCRVPLHPESISEGAASLLPGTERPALLWTLDLDGDGELGDAHLERSRVRSREALSYRTVQNALDAGSAPAPLELLREIGTLREARERDRGGVSLRLASQEVVEQDGGYALRYDAPIPVEDWNAQISLLAGIAAARIMLDARVGLLRTLPPPDAEVLAELRAAAAALDVAWPEDASYAAVVRDLDPARPAEAALLAQAARGLRGAGYEAFDGAVPEHGFHAAVASPYAHVTAPLRRMCDRFTNEVVLAACAGRRPPGWALDALPALPRLMGRTRRRARALERAIVDFVEALVLEPRVGERFDALVTHADPRRLRVQLREPAVRASLDPKRVAGSPPRLGQALRLRLARVDVEKRRVDFEAEGGADALP